MTKLSVNLNRSLLTHPKLHLLNEGNPDLLPGSVQDALVGRLLLARALSHENLEDLQLSGMTTLGSEGTTLLLGALVLVNDLELERRAVLLGKLLLNRELLLESPLLLSLTRLSPAQKLNLLAMLKGLSDLADELQLPLLHALLHARDLGLRKLDASLLERGNLKREQSELLLAALAEVELLGEDLRGALVDALLLVSTLKLPAGKEGLVKERTSGLLAGDRALALGLLLAVVMFIVNSTAVAHDGGSGEGAEASVTSRVAEASPWAANGRTDINAVEPREHWSEGAYGHVRASVTDDVWFVTAACVASTAHSMESAYWTDRATEPVASAARHEPAISAGAHVDSVKHFTAGEAVASQSAAAVRTRGAEASEACRMASHSTGAAYEPHAVHSTHSQGFVRAVDSANVACEGAVITRHEGFGQGSEVGHDVHRVIATGVDACIASVVWTSVAASTVATTDTGAHSPATHRPFSYVPNYNNPQVEEMV